MFKVLSLLLTTGLILIPGAQAADKIFGERPSLKNTVKISAILDAPEKYLGKVIQVEGIVMDVCPMRGCWMKVKSDRKKENLFIKVNDGEMVFPMSARGKNTVIKGKSCRLKMSLKSKKPAPRKKVKSSIRRVSKAPAPAICLNPLAL